MFEHESDGPEGGAHPVLGVLDAAAGVFDDSQGVDVHDHADVHATV
jgi:hypothetical protein